jgi:hypothetical protein
MLRHEIVNLQIRLRGVFKESASFAAIRRWRIVDDLDTWVEAK